MNQHLFIGVSILSKIQLYVLQSGHNACRPRIEYLEPVEVVLCDLIVVLVRMEDDRKSEPGVGAVTPAKLLLRGLGGDAYLTSATLLLLYSPFFYKVNFSSNADVI